MKKLLTGLLLLLVFHSGICQYSIEDTTTTPSGKALLLKKSKGQKVGGIVLISAGTIVGLGVGLGFEGVPSDLMSGAATTTKTNKPNKTAGYVIAVVEVGLGILLLQRSKANKQKAMNLEITMNESKMLKQKLVTIVPYPALTMTVNF